MIIMVNVLGVKARNPLSDMWGYTPSEMFTQSDVPINHSSARCWVSILETRERDVDQLDRLFRSDLGEEMRRCRYGLDDRI